MATCTIVIEITDGKKTIKVRYRKEDVFNNPPTNLWAAIANPPDLGVEPGREVKYFIFYNHSWSVGNNVTEFYDDGKRKKLVSVTLHTDPLTITEAGRLLEALEKNGWGLL
jgi:hypothetical protein